MTRVVVFVDYGTARWSGHETFGNLPLDEHPPELDPIALSQLIVRGRGTECELTEVRIYRAVPNGRIDERGFSLALWQLDRWARAGAVVVRRPTREIDPRIRTGNPSSIVVALAIDVVLLAWRDRYDVAIVCSSDEDLEPALKAVLDQTWKNVEVAAWRSPTRRSPRLIVAGERIRCHWLGADLYAKVVDHPDLATSGA